jgi:uncharacterized protein YbaR (Trm112 family)
MSVTSVAPVAFRIEAGRGECDGGHRRFRKLRSGSRIDRHDSIICRSAGRVYPIWDSLDGTMHRPVGGEGSGSRGGATVQGRPMAEAGRYQQ